MADFATVKIPTSLKEEIQYYRKKNKAIEPFNKFVIAQLEDGLQDQILKSMAKLEHSYRCKDANPKTKRLVFTVVGKTSEYFVCDKCAKRPEFGNMDSEEDIVWEILKPNNGNLD